MAGTELNLSIVIITWKMKKLLSGCLESIYRYTSGLSFEIILVDNFSDDGTVEMIEKEFKNIRLIKNNENKGVAPARNQGMGIAKGDYVLILDADIELVENTFLELFKFMEENKLCGIVGSRLTDVNGDLQFSCKRFPTFLAFLFRRLEHFEPIKNSKILKNHTMQDWDHSEIQEVDYIIGACQFIRKSVIDKIGFYDDNIFYGPEDIDYCLRVWKAGWKIYYNPKTSMIHHEQRITKKNIFSHISYKHLLGIIYLYRKYRFKIRV